MPACPGAPGSGIARRRVTVEEILASRDSEALEKVRERNAESEPDDVLDDVTAEVEVVRQSSTSSCAAHYVSGSQVRE